VFQDSSVDGDLTAHENMDVHGALYGVPRAQRRERIEKLLGFVELWDRRGDYVKQFSGGMTRRLEIARALLHEPKIVFLDEPTVGLDPQTRRRIWDYLRRVSRERGTTVFFTTHYMDEAERSADEVAIIDRGRLVAQGTPAEINARAGGASLEESFIALTGHAIRDEEPSSERQKSIMKRMWGGRR
jgi:ABC-2 type transport system ATP-binding protein